MTDIVKAINDGSPGLALAIIFACVFLWMIYKVMQIDVMKSELKAISNWLESIDGKLERAIERREHPRN